MSLNSVLFNHFAMTTVQLFQNNIIKVLFLFDFKQLIRSVYLRSQFYVVAPVKFNK
jgi:hypothetical protein